MATKLHNESRRHYSWWWVSHISPKNSKWLQENLADADMKVNTIIKLLEEDADSFARRAEMYYKKRPELMKLVEELYRAYRALAEKYDHATGALRQAHRTMAEAFPNQIPLLLSDESPSASSGSEAEPHTPEAPPPLRAFFDPDDLTRDALGFSTELHVIKRNGAYSEPNDSLSNKKGLKQLNEMFETGNGTTCSSEGRVRKGLNFQGEERESLENKALKCSREQNHVREKPDFSQLSVERDNLKNQITAETDRANKAINELQSLKGTMSKLMIEKDEDKSQYQMSQQKISVLESELSAAHDELKKLNDEMGGKVRKLQSTEEINQSQASEIDMLTKKAKLLEHELNQKQQELAKLDITIEENHQKCIQMEATLHLKEKLHTQSQNEANHLSQEIKKEIQKLRDMELCNADLQEEIRKLKKEFDYLHGQNLHSTSMIEEFKDRITLLEEKNRVLEEVHLHLDEKNILNQELLHVKEDRIYLQKKYEDLVGQMDLVDVHVESLETIIKSLHNENSELKVISKKHEAEKLLLVEEVKDKENILERNAILENSLSDASLELKVLRQKILSLEDLHGSLNGEISTYVAEKKTLVSQSESLTQDVNIVSEKNLLLEKSLSDINIEVGYLRSKLKDLEESSQLLSDQNSDLLSERNDLLGQIETLIQNVEKHLMHNSLLERSLSDVSSEVQWLKSKLTESEESCQSITDQNSDLLAERNTLLSQVKILTEDMDKLLDDKSSLENSLYDVGSEIVGLRANLKDSEESCHSLSHQNSGLLAERNSLFSQVGVLTQNMEKLSHKNASLENSLSDVSNEAESLRSKLKDFEESCHSLSHQNSGLIAERSSLVSQVDVFTQYMENLLQKDASLENSLSDVSKEVESLRSKLKDCEESCQSLRDQNSDLLAERNNVLSQLETHTQNMVKLSEKNCLLEGSLSDVRSEVYCLRSKLKDSEESCKSLSDQSSCLLTERTTLVSQLDALTQNVGKLSDKNSFLENSITDLGSEVECLRSELKDLDESCQSLTNKNSDLLAERNTLESHVKVLLQNVEKLSEKKTILENSLFDSSNEVELLKSKLKDSEDSYQLLSDQYSSLLDERNTVLSQLEVLRQNAEELSDNNSFLENSLSAVSSEVGVLMSKLKDSEESYQSLHSQNSSLLIERSILVSQVESITLNLESLENSLLESKHNNFKISEERDLMTNRVKGLQDLLKLEKVNNEILVQSCKSQLAALENQIFLLRQENQLKEQELEAEQNNLIDALIENFVLQSFLCDVNSRNLALSVECEKNLQLYRNAEVITSQLEQEKLIDIKNMTTLSERNQKLLSGIRLLHNSLNEDKDYSFSDEIQGEVCLDIVVKNILTFVSEAEYDNQLLHLDISVLITLLKHTMLDLASLRFEKFSLERELGDKTKELSALRSKEHELLVLHENLQKGLDASNSREIELKTEMKVLYLQLADLQESFQTYKCEIQNLIEEKKILTEEIYHLRQKHNVLEEENREVLAEAMKLDHLCLFYRSLSADRLVELKSFAYDLDSLHFVKNNLLAEVDKLKVMISVLKGENMHLMDSLTCLKEEFRNHLLLSEFNLITTAWVCEELDLETQSTEKQLKQKQSQLSETNQEVQSIQLKNMELCKTIECLQMDIETGKLVKEGLEQKISNLSEVVAHKCEEIRCLCEANEMLKEELYLKHAEVDVPAGREEDFLSEFKKERDENERCEGEIELLLSEIQVSTIDAALYKEKLHELAIEEEVCSMLQKEVLVMEIALIKEYVNSLKKKLDHLEGESVGLKADLNAYASLVTSLWNDIISLEQQIVCMAKLGLSNDPDKKVSHLHHDDSQAIDGEGMNIEGVSTLKKLITKVKFLQEVMTEIQIDGEQGDLDDGSNSGVAGEGTKGPEKKENGWPQEVRLSLHATRQSDDGRSDVSSKGKSGQTMKDIQLDHDSKHLPFRTIGSYGLSRINNDEINDQLWEAAEKNCSNRTPKASTAASEDGIEPAEEVKSEYPSSELMVEKELSIDKLEKPNKASTSGPEWNKRLLGRLKTDAQRLSDLKTSVAELKRKMEGSQMGKLPPSFGYDTIKLQLKDAEASAAELIDGNKKLTTKAEEYLKSNALGAKSEQTSSSTRRRQLSEQARRESDKIGRLELELHKIQYVLLKLEEEQGSRHANTTERRARTLLRDYIYGRRDGRGMKKRGLCVCMRPETKGNL